MKIKTAVSSQEQCRDTAIFRLLNVRHASGAVSTRLWGRGGIYGRDNSGYEKGTDLEKSAFIGFDLCSVQTNIGVGKLP